MVLWISVELCYFVGVFEEDAEAVDLDELGGVVFAVLFGVFAERLVGIDEVAVDEKDEE